MLGLAPFFQQLPEYPSVYRVISLLQVYQQVELALLWTVNLVQESACVDCSGLPFFETCLVNLRLDQVWRLRLDSLKYGFLHDLRQVRAHHDWPDIVQAAWTFGVSLL